MTTTASSSSTSTCASSQSAPESISPIEACGSSETATPAPYGSTGERHGRQVQLRSTTQGATSTLCDPKARQRPQQGRPGWPGGGGPPANGPTSPRQAPYPPPTTK